MKRPTLVGYAILAIWATFGLTVASAAASRALGYTSSSTFMASLFIFAVLAVIPYKIGMGRNWARFAYAILTLLSMASLFAGETQAMSPIDKVFNWVLLPVDVWAVYALFTKEASGWFVPEAVS